MQRISEETEFKYIQKLILDGGPNSKEEIEKFSDWVREKAILFQDKKIADEVVNKLKELFSPLHNMDTIIGISYLKPFGYSGDYKVIDMVYQNHISTNPKLSNWDKWVQSTNGLKAVRNRKDYFKNCLLQLSTKNPNAKVCNIASGPCRDILEYFSENPNSKIAIHCIDHDANAINYSKELLKDVRKNNYTLTKGNIFKYHTDSKFDFVWSAGLFDYFDDSTFVKILRKLYGFVNQGGILIVGNFSWKSETRYIKQFVNWHLNYRSNHLLIELAKTALGNNVLIEIETEPEGVNLFLNIRKE